MAGISAGAGVDVPILHAHLRPEFRYSHWFQSSTGAYGIPVVGNLIPSGDFSSFLLGNVAGTPFKNEQNEASFLLSLSF